MAKVEQILVVPLKEVALDPKWNARSQRALLAEGENEDENSLASLVESIREKGQFDPIDVIPYPGKAEGVKYFAITGFRRAEAIRLISEGWKPAENAEAKPTFDGPKNDNPTIRVVVREYNDLDARIRNISENTSRNALSAADVAFGVREIIKLDKSFTAEQIGQLTGLSRSYVSKLYWIAKALKADVFKHWRESPGSPVNLATMYVIAKKPVEEQQKLYEEETSARVRGEKGKAGDWVSAAIRRGAAVGELLGDLEREFQLDVSSTVDFADALPILVKLPDNSKSAERKKVIKAIQDAFNTSKDYVEAEEDEEAAE